MFDHENSFVLSEILEDTQPIQVQVAPISKYGGRDKLGWFCLIGAIVFTVATAFVIALPTTPPSAEVDNAENRATTVAVLPTIAVDTVTGQDSFESDLTIVTPLPTISPQEIAGLLSTPPIADTSNPMVIVRDIYDPFTFIPDRPRAEVIEYMAEPGDTIGAIAERFGLKPETIAWSNPRSYIQILQPGNRLNILPIDGIYHSVLIEQTVASVASQYNVDPYVIIDSEYNDLFNTTPETVLMSGTRLVVPGGTGEQIAWTPQVVRVAASGGSGNASSGGQISFSPGDPGSCALVDNPGGGAGWVRPINGYTWIRGYASWHPAADLAVPEGTTVVAANSGRVIFAGWNSFGYGYAVVLAHGPFTTIYAHLSGVSVGCGQDVSAGQVIGATGNTGNSSGPHLHFEVRYNDIPQDPSYVVAL